MKSIRANTSNSKLVGSFVPYISGYYTVIFLLLIFVSASWFVVKYNHDHQSPLPSGSCLLLEGSPLTILSLHPPSGTSQALHLSTKCLQALACAGQCLLLRTSISFQNKWYSSWRSQLKCHFHWWTSCPRQNRLEPPAINFLGSLNIPFHSVHHLSSSNEHVCGGLTVTVLSVSPGSPI